MKTLSESIGRNLRRYRALRGLPAFELAQRSGIARATLSALEAGRGNPTLDTLAAVAAVLGVDVVDLIEGAPQAMTIARAGSPSDVGDAPSRLLRRFRAGPCSIDLHAFVLPSGATLDSEAHDPGVLEHVLVHTGSLEIVLDPNGSASKRAQLGPGDYASFTADAPHRYCSLEGEVRGSLILHYATNVSETAQTRSSGDADAVSSKRRAITSAGELA